MDKFLSKSSSKAALDSDSKKIEDSVKADVNTSFIPWVEKYRPNRIDEVAYQDEVLATLRSCIKGEDVPHMLFYGPPGTGKTTTILAFCKELYGDKFWRERVLELNSSDERGINVVRQKVKTFAGTAVSAIKGDGSPAPPFKVVILDEADSMTNAAQSALRRTMEVHSKSTRFCLICNYVSRIIDPITSRCAKFRFKSLSSDQMSKRLRLIADSEKVKVSDSAVEALITLSEGDMRKSITFLQSVSTLKSGSAVSEEDILEVSGFIKLSVIDRWLQVCASGSFERVQSFVQGVIADGYAANQLFSQLHDAVVYLDRLDDPKKAKVLEKLSMCDRRLMDGASEYLQLMDVSCEIMRQSC